MGSAARLLTGMVADALGNPIHVQLSSGNIHDENIAEDVPDHVDLGDVFAGCAKVYVFGEPGSDAECCCSEHANCIFAAETHESATDRWKRFFRQQKIPAVHLGRDFPAFFTYCNHIIPGLNIQEIFHKNGKFVFIFLSM